LCRCRRVRDQSLHRQALPPHRGGGCRSSRRGAGRLPARDHHRGDDPQAACTDRRDLQRCRRHADAQPRQGEMTRAYLALGGNVGDSRALLARAVDMLATTPGVTLVARSSDYRTPPWGVTDQAPFVNLAVAIDTSLKPLAL